MRGTLGCDVNPVVGAVAFPVIFIFSTTLWEPLSLEQTHPDHLSLSPMNVPAHGQQLQALSLSPGEGLERDWGAWQRRWLPSTWPASYLPLLQSTVTPLPLTLGAHSRPQQCCS